MEFSAEIYLLQDLSVAIRPIVRALKGKLQRLPSSGRHPSGQPRSRPTSPVKTVHILDEILKSVRVQTLFSYCLYFV